MPLTHQRRTRARGFTLIELMVVIVILALLIGLLLPAIMSAVRKGHEAQVLAEINAMSQALTAFKNQYGDYPPSRVVLVETGDYSAGNLGVAIALAPRTMSAIRKFWPRVLLSSSGPIGPGYDFNGNGKLDTGFAILTGDECLVFFLGGIPSFVSASQQFSATGFSKTPTNPFINATAAPDRQAPFFDFASNRLTDINGNGFPEFKDTLDSVATNGTYAYFSAYGGVGYDPDDVNYIVSASTGYPASLPDYQYAQDLSLTSIMGGFQSSNIVTSSGADATRLDWISSPSPNPYVADDPIPVAAGTFNTADHRPRVWINPQSFQILSPGYDRIYGIGGQYNANGKIPGSVTSMSNVLPFTSPDQMKANNDVTGQTLPLDVRSVERDNLSNFATGRLDP